METIRGEKWEAFAERHGDSGRDLALYVLRQYGGVTLKQASTCVGIENYSAAAQALRRFRKRLQADRTLRRQLNAVLNCIRIKTDATPARPDPTQMWISIRGASGRASRG